MRVSSLTITLFPTANDDVLYVRLLAGKYRPPKIQILLTKCDLVKRIDLARRVVMVRQQLDEVQPPLLPWQTCSFVLSFTFFDSLTG